MDVRNKFVGLCYNPDFVSVYCALQGYQVNGISETIFLPLDLNPFRFKAHCPDISLLCTFGIHVGGYLAFLIVFVSTFITNMRLCIRTL